MLEDHLLDFEPREQNAVSPGTFTYNLESIVTTADEEILPNPPVMV